MASDLGRWVEKKTREVGLVRGLWSLVRGLAGEEVRPAWFVDRPVGLVVFEKERKVRGSADWVGSF